MKLRFALWHLVVLTLVVAIAIAVARHTTVESYPYTTAETVSRLNVTIAPGFELIESIGDLEGPYKSGMNYHEGVPADKTVPPNARMRVNYRVGGIAKVYEVPNDDKTTTIVSIFENAKGNHLLLIYEKPWE